MAESKAKAEAKEEADSKLNLEQNGKKEECVNLADVSKQVAEMLANAKAEAEKIIAEAKAAASNELTDEQKEARAKDNAYWNEEVEIELFYDGDKYKDDVFVSVNGETVAIKRGEKVKIKRKFAHVLDNSREQDKAASNYMKMKVNEFVEKTKELN